MRYFLAFFLLICTESLLAFDMGSGKKFKLSFSVGNPNDNLTVKTTRESETNSDFDQIEFRPSFVYFLNDKLAAGAYFFQKTLLADFESNGIGGFFRYYFMNFGSVTHSKLGNMRITSSPTWTPFLDLGVKKETLEAGAVSISFSGLEAAAGVDWHWKGDYFISTVVYISSQFSGESRSLTSISFLLGFGKAFSI